MLGWPERCLILRLAARALRLAARALHAAPFVASARWPGSLARPSDAWGFTAHKFIMDRAIALLPPEIRPFFESYRTTVVEHAIDPDTYRTMGFVEEPPRHFLDMDAYGAAAVHGASARLRTRRSPSTAGRSSLKNGLLPWRTQEIADRLRDAFKQTTPFARDDIKLFSAVITHYIGDAFQPFHAALNYDGQLTGQQGVHSRFEAELFERYQDKLHVTPAPMTTGRQRARLHVRGAGRQLPAGRRDACGGPRRGGWPGRSTTTSTFAKFFARRAADSGEAHFRRRSRGAASIITSAWVQAGKPALPATAPPRSPDRFDRAAVRRSA